ncbi:uncharacterized protein [Typha angustifolia]|uniref:uncharacterized protein n=1 Tax=Typha angustifolia TaxID=59011 RepID=UPI003C2B5089
MQCSISTASSSSNWLDRLHTSKGFSIPTDLDLDHFLTSTPNSNHNPNPNPNSKNEVDSSSVRRRRKGVPPDSSAASKIGDKKSHLFDLMSSVLAELFVMGDGTLSEGKRKSSRKQANPRVCINSASASANGGGGGGVPPAASPSSADNSVAEAKKGQGKGRRKRGPASGAAVAVDSDRRLLCSKTEVTVIDTSAPVWKSQKLIFRKGMVWKVRDKKVWNASRKKRKLGLVEKLVSEKGNKQAAVELEVPAVAENSVSLDEENSPAAEEDAFKDSDEIQIPLRRPKFSRSPRIPAVKNSSILRLQVITKGRKKGISFPKGSLKGR